MGIWIGVALVGLIAAGIGIKRLLVRSAGSSDLGLGEVSQSWLTEQRADKNDH